MYGRIQEIGDRLLRSLRVDDAPSLGTWLCVLEAMIRHYDYRFRDQPFDDFGVIWQALSSGTDPRRRPRRT